MTVGRELIRTTIQIEYQGRDAGVCQAVVTEEHEVSPPRPGLNTHVLEATGNYLGDEYVVRSNSGGIDGALAELKQHIESTL
jgi:hypothetical protein